jgi:hypothetical protein
MSAGDGYQPPGTAANGGSGIVVLRTLDALAPIATTTGSPTITVLNGYRIYKWTTSGSILFAIPKPPAAPESVTATVGTQRSFAVAFSAPANNGSTITQYRVTSASNLLTKAGTASPITITGVTPYVEYTFKVTASNAIGLGATSAESNAVIYPPPGQQEYTSPGTYSWIAPEDVTKVSVVAVGGGGTTDSGGGGGGGGGLGWKNNITVVPGQSYTVVVGIGGDSGYFQSGQDGGDSYFINTTTVKGGGGQYGRSIGYPDTRGYGGTYVGDGGGNGGRSYRGTSSSGGQLWGGGGAGGYSGNGGSGGWADLSGSGNIRQAGESGYGGGGGGGGSTNGVQYFGNGGGVGIFGQGTSGAASQPGSGGSGKLYGGGSLGSGDSGNNQYRAGGGGAVRLIWGGITREFPSTNTGNL